MGYPTAIEALEIEFLRSPESRGVEPGIYIVECRDTEFRERAEALCEFSSLFNVDGLNVELDMLSAEGLAVDIGMFIE